MIHATHKIVFLLMLLGCQPVGPRPSSDLQFDSAHSIALDGSISDGVVFSTTDSKFAVKSQIKEQLMYTIGQLNGIGGGPDMNQLEISLGEIAKINSETAEEGEETTEPDRYKVNYAAKMLIAWPRDLETPETFELVLPSQANYQGRKQFFKTYGDTCVDPNAHDNSSAIFWYYYRPQQCDLPDSHELFVRIPIKLVPSLINTTGKSPEYEKVWEDDKLIVTAIFGKAENDATNRWDAGISAYGQTYRKLIYKYGLPLKTTFAGNLFSRPGVKNPIVEMEFETDSGILDINLMLVDGIQNVSDEFKAHYNKRTKISDLVTYSGHSGLGANIRALAKMGEFAKDQYQIFLINGCDTFAYVDDALATAHAKANPDSKPTKFLDLITNAMPSFFHMNANSNMTLIDALVDKELSYREILAGFDSRQKAVVTGEEDND